MFSYINWLWCHFHCEFQWNFLNRSGQNWENNEVVSCELPWFIIGTEEDENQESTSSNKLTVFTGHRYFHQNFYCNVQVQVQWWFQELIGCVFTQSISAKISDEVNPVYLPNVFNFYLALSATSCKSFDFLSGELLGPAIRKIQRRREIIGQNPFISLISRSFNRRWWHSLRVFLIN